MAILNSEILRQHGAMMANNVKNDIDRMLNIRKKYENNSRFSIDDPFKLHVTIVLDNSDKHYMGLKKIELGNPNPQYDSYAYEDYAYLRLGYFEIMKLLKLDPKTLKVYYQKPFYESMREFLEAQLPNRYHNDILYVIPTAQEEYDKFVNGKNKVHKFTLSYHYYTAEEAVKIFYELIYKICLKLKENAFTIHSLKDFL